MFTDDKPSDRAILAARCHEIQVGLGSREVPEFEAIPLLGMAIRLALHIRGLEVIDYSVLKLVASHFLAIPAIALERIVRLLGEVEFVRISQTGDSIEAVLPTVPYYDTLYDQIGEYAQVGKRFNEPEELAIFLLNRLAGAPENVDALLNASGADPGQFNRAVTVGTSGSYLISRRVRGKDILLSPTYFSENADIFADVTAGRGADDIRKVIRAVQTFQGFPLGLVEATGRYGSVDLSPEQIKLLKRLAQDGAVKPPSIMTKHAGENYFLFTPTPGIAALSPTKRDIYERAMAIVAAVRQGQLLPHRYSIKSPGAVLYKLKTELKLGKATTEAAEQYRNLVHLRVGRLVSVGTGAFSRFEIVDTPENREALDIAYALVTSGEVSGLEVDEDARAALHHDQQYVESLIASGEMRKREQINLGPDQQYQIDLLFTGEAAP